MQSNLHLEYFDVSSASVNGFNPRPRLSDRRVTDMPISLGEAVRQQLLNSFRVEKSDGYACAASARLWENLLDNHRVPYLMLRVADVRMRLNREKTAIVLYEELNAILQNVALSLWLRDAKTRLKSLIDKDLADYTSPSNILLFAENQRWKATAGVDSFPRCQLDDRKMETLKGRWESLRLRGDDIRKRYLDKWSVEASTISDIRGLGHIQVGFLSQVMNSTEILHPDSALIRDKESAIAVLRDISQATEKIVSFIRSGNNLALTLEFVVDLHAKVMKSSRVLFFNDFFVGRSESISFLQYTSTGATRQTIGVQSTMYNDNDEKVQFCPSDQVDAELRTFCDKFNLLMCLVMRREMDPFAAAAWISHVFTAIHPFEDGNGRTSRLLASIPLIIQGLPPICVTMSNRKLYNRYLNNIRVRRDGDYKDLMQVLYSSTTESLGYLERLVRV